MKLQLVIQKFFGFVSFPNNVGQDKFKCSTIKGRIHNDTPNWTYCVFTAVNHLGTGSEAVFDPGPAISWSKGSHSWEAPECDPLPQPEKFSYSDQLVVQ